MDSIGHSANELSFCFFLLGDPAGAVIIINAKNCSLSIVLTATDQKPQKSLKSTWFYPPSHRLNVNMMLSRPNMTLLMIYKWVTWPWPHPFQGWLVVCKLDLATVNLHTKFEVSNTHCKDMKSGACKMYKLGWFGALRGHSRSSAMSLLDRVIRL